VKKKEQVLRSNQSQMNFMIKTSEARLAYEQEKLNSIYKARAALLGIDKEQLMYDREIADKRVGLNTLMNRDKNSSFEIDSTYRIRDFSMILTDTSSVAHSRSDIRMIDQSVKLMALNRKMELSRRNPDFGVRFDHMFGLGSQPDQFTLMGMITIPVMPWSSRSYRSNIKAMDLETQSMQKEKEAMVNEVSGKLISLKNQAGNLKKQLNLYETGIIPALKKNYQTTMLAYEQNTADLFLVIDAWQTLTMTEIQSLDTLGELLEIQVEIEKEMEAN
jgi:outer membrane protein TolC